MVLDGDLTKDNLEGIIRSLAAALGVEPSLIEIPVFATVTRRQSTRRAPVSITFKLFVDTEKQNEIRALIQSESFSNILAMKLDKEDIEASVASTGICSTL